MNSKFKELVAKIIKKTNLKSKFKLVNILIPNFRD